METSISKRLLRLADRGVSDFAPVSTVSTELYASFGARGPKANRASMRTTCSAQRDVTALDHEVSPAKCPTLDSKSLGKGSRRLAGFKALFRSRKSHLRLMSESSVQSYKPTIVVEEITSHKDDQHQPVGLQIGQCNSFLNEDSDARKVSDKTDYSLHSDLTSVTVCHNPSKRKSMPIALVDQECLYHDPYSDFQQTSHTTPRSSAIFGDNPRCTTHCARPRQHSSECSGASILSNCPIRTQERPEKAENPFAHARSSRSRGSSSRQSSDLSTTYDDTSSSLAQGDRRAAVIAFNELAGRLHLELLGLDEADGGHGEGEWSPLPG